MASTMEDGIYEHGPYKTREEAEQRAPEEMDLLSGATYYIGRINVWRYRFQGRELASMVAQDALDEFEEPVKSWCDDVEEKGRVGALDELCMELDAHIAGWLSNHGLRPDFGEMVEVKEMRA